MTKRAEAGDRPKERIASDSGEAVTASADPRRLLATWSRLHRPALLRFFQRRLPPGPDSEDLVQEVFLSLARRGDLRHVGHIESYIFAAARNALSDWRRKQSTHAAAMHEELDADIADGGPTPERSAIGRDEFRRLLAVLGALPERTQAVFVLYHFEGLTQAAIARRLGIAQRTVEDHMARANARILNVARE